MVFVKLRAAAARSDYAKNGVGPDDNMTDKCAESAKSAGVRGELLSREELRYLNEWLTVNNQDDDYKPFANKTIYFNLTERQLLKRYTKLIETKRSKKDNRNPALKPRTLPKDYFK